MLTIDILQELKDYQDAWLNLRLGPESVKSLPALDDSPVHHLRDGKYIGIFHERTPGDGQVGVYRPFDHIQVADLNTLALPPPLKLREFHAFTADPKQNLTVLIEYDGQWFMFQHIYIHFYDITTGQPHPLAHFPILTVQLTEFSESTVPAYGGSRAIVMGDLLIVSLLGHGSANILIWNWQRVRVTLSLTESTYRMSRQLRSGRSYDASKEPQVPKRKTRQRKAAGAKADANEQASETNSKQLIVPRERERLTFGTAPGERNPRESVHIIGTGRRRGVALVGNDAVKLSPSAYAALTNRAPPIRRVLSWPTPAIETRMIADAPKEGEAAVPRNAEAAVRVPGEQELTPGGTDRAPAAVRAPETPSTNMRRKDTSSDDDVYVTARTSRVCDESIVLDSEGEPLLAQYVVNDDTSKTPPLVASEGSAGAGLTWDEEVRRVNGEDPGGPNTSLPDISEWVNPDWSRSDYIHESNEQSAGTDGESVQVNALIFEVDDNYVYDDDEYVEVLRNLRNQDRSESTHSQSRGAGPSQARQTHRVTVEEIDEETETTETSRTRSYVGKGKGKKKPRERSRKRKRPSLGMALDDLEGSRGERGRPTVSREPSVTYRGGGYLEGLISPSPARPTMNAENDRETVPRGDRGGLETSLQPVAEEPTHRLLRWSRRLHRMGKPSDSDSSDSDYSSTNESISSRSTGTTRQQTSRELEDIVRKLRKQNERLEKKIVTQARSGYKAQTPKAYKGEADIDKYDMFIFNYKLYLSDTKLSDRKAVLTVSRFLEDKAATWYMMNVAPDPEAYTMETIYVGLYEYCFPPDFKEEVRRQYNQKRQGDLSQHVLRIWEGAAQYIKVEWALKYMQPETTDLDTLREAALAAERAHKIKRKIERSGNEKSNPQRSGRVAPLGRTTAVLITEARLRIERGNRDHRSGNYNGNGNRTDKRQDENRHKTREGGREEANTRKEKLTNEERDRLKAAGLCYVCQRSGHLARDCPKFHKARPSHIRANVVKVRPEEKVRVSSVMLKELDELTRLGDRIEVNAVRVGQKNDATTKHIERNAVKIKDNTRKVPDTLVVKAKIEGKSVRVLLDSGCQTDLISSTLVDQLKLDKTALTKPLQVQLAMAGSRGTLHYCAQARIEYQTVNKNRQFDVGNLDNYDVILGTPFLFQHSVRLSFNPYGVYIGSDKALPLDGDHILQINSLSTEIVGTRMAELREMLREEAAEVCKPANGTIPLPPMRAINHRIPLIDKAKQYRFRPSRCPEALKSQFESKARDYLKSGRWKHSTGSNAIPMLFLPKKKDGKVELRTVLDKRKQNANTVKLASPLPLPEDILSEVSRHRYKTLLDGKDAYETDTIEMEDTRKQRPTGKLPGSRGIPCPELPGIRIPMAPLAKRASGDTPFRWGGLEERAFREVIQLVEEYRDKHRQADWSAKGRMADGRSSSLLVGQVHNGATELHGDRTEALAIVASLDKFRPLLYGVKFEVLTNHKALEFLLTQKELNARQVRWLETINEFDCTIRYIEGSQNVLADALSRMYSEDKKGTVRAASEYMADIDGSDTTGNAHTPTGQLTRPVITGMAAKVAAKSRVTSEGVRRNPARNCVAPKRYDPEIPGRGDYGRIGTRAPKRRNANDKANWDPDRREEFDEIMNGSTEAGSETRETESMSSPASVELEGGNTTGNKVDPTDRSDHRHITQLVSEIDVVSAIAEGYKKDKDYEKIIEEPSQFPQFELRKELIYFSKHGRLYLCVPNTTSGDWHIRTLLISHAHSMVSHLGYKKTYAYMRESLYWKGMANDTKRFCNACVSCASSKTSTQKPYGLLKPLPIPKYPWAQVGVDFFGPLPESTTLLGTFDMICAVIDHLTCMTHLIPTRSDYTARDMAEVFHANVFRLHGIPEIIISDRDKLFTSIFWQTFYSLTGTEIRLSSAFHPQTDGMTERLIRSMSGIIRVCVNPALRDWALKLPSIEFAINSARSETTGFSPFSLNYGRVPRPMLVRTGTDMHGVREAARNIKYALMIAHDAIIGARVSQMVESNRHRRPSPFKQGDRVYVSTKNMRVPMGKPHKLLAQWIGPVVIDGVVKEGATYHVELPEDLRRRGIKAIFHASLLKPHIPYEDRRFPGRNYKQIASLEADDDEWAVEKIVGHRGKGSNAVFEIVWQTGDRTWETYRVVRHLEALKQYFEAIGVKRARDLPWAEGGDTPYDELSDSGSETLEGASIRVLKEGDPEYKHLTTPLSNIKLTELLSLYKGCPTADAGDVVGTTTDNETNHQRINRTSTTESILGYCGCSTPSHRPASKPSEPVTPKYSEEADEGAWGHARDISTITRTSVEGRWTCTKVLLASVFPKRPTLAWVNVRLTDYAQEGALDEEELNLVLGRGVDRPHVAPRLSEAVAGQLPGEGASPRAERKTAVSTRASTPPNSRSASRSSSDDATGSDRESTAEPTTPTAPDPNQRGAIGLQINDLSDRDPQRARQENSPARRGQGVGHHGRYVKDRTTGSKDRGRTKDRRRELPSGTTKASLPGAPVHAGDHGTSDRRPHTGDRGTLVDNQGEQGDFETLRAVAAPESSVGEDEADSNDGSDGGPEPSATERDDPDVRDATDHVAKWTTLGPDVEMRDAGNGLKTLEPEQPCVSPRKLELKRSSVRRRSDRVERKGEGKGTGGDGEK
ncbi:hypothetical protein RHS01_07224 [Rhizoctonia solani]|uniref:RNA-directed DNA polymerase n=1 Tax=Rhizoctonia solani TaxID=456999 RepID=A0A8H7M3F5_9AGAM|nr:hypothetical protein RHS01_07224 [Rhizoctonia solani]